MENKPVRSCGNCKFFTPVADKGSCGICELWDSSFFCDFEVLANHHVCCGYSPASKQDPAPDQEASDEE